MTPTEKYTVFILFSQWIIIGLWLNMRKLSNDKLRVSVCELICRYLEIELETGEW